MGSSLSKPLRLAKNCWRARKSSPLPTATIQQDSYNQQASQELNAVLHEPNPSQFAYHGGITANPETPNSLQFLSPPPLPTASLSPIGEERGVYAGETLAPGCLMASTTVPTEPQYGKPPTPLTPSVAATASVGKAPALQEELPPPINGDEPRDAEMLDDITARDIKRSLLWGKAIDSLQKKGLKGLGGGQVETKAPVDSLIKQVQALRKEVDEKRISYQKADGQDVFIADQIFGQLNKYAFIGDIALQHNPDVVALVWAGFRLLLNIGSAYTENLARILSSLGYLSWVICCGAIYEHLYLHLEQRSIPALEKCLIKQYASILEYLLYAKNHLEQTTGVQIMKSLSSKLAEQLRIIQETEKETKMHADLVDKEVMSLERSKQDRSRKVFERHLRDIRGQLREVGTTLSECHANIKRLGQFVDKQIRSTTLDWVSTTQYGKIHSEHYKRRADNTCLWLKTNPKFDNWVSSRSSSSVLWLRGNAGTGKTILASFAIELLKKTLPTDGCLAYFYCSINHMDRSSPSSILRALLRQICIAYSHDRLPSALEELKEQKERGSDDVLTVKESSGLIIELSRQLPSLWIVIDALDECDKDSREDLFDALKTIEHEGEGVRIFITGRNQGDITAYMNDYENYLIDPQDSLVDIKIYIKSELDKLYKNPTKKGMVEDMKKEEDKILTALLKDIDGMFLSIHLKMQALARETSIEGVTNTLAVFPQGLTTMYDEIFSRIAQQSTTDQLSALKVIQWLFYAKDDFSPKTIIQALNANLSPATELSDNAIEQKIDNMIYVCCGLIVHDPETGVLRFSHATVKQYLEDGSKDCLKGGEEWILLRCLSILTCPESERPDPSSLTLSRHDFITYSMRNWGLHLRGSVLTPPWSTFLDPTSPDFQFWAYNVGKLIPTLQAPTGKPISLVWAACYYGLSNVVEENLHSLTPTCTNFAGRTPLHYLAEKGDVALIEKLVNKTTVNINAKDTGDITPLILAVKYNKVEIVRFLRMQACCDINLSDENGLAAIHHAAAEGHATVLKDLVRDPRLNVINHKSRKGSTALSLAVSGGHVSAVEALLQHQDIDPNCEDTQYETPLLTAARFGYQSVIEALIKHERVDANCGLGSDNLFIKAAEEGKTWLVKLLLGGKNIAIDRQGINGWTALYNAVVYNKLEVLELLLSLGADITVADENGSTAFRYALQCGKMEQITLFLSYSLEIITTTPTMKLDGFSAAIRADNIQLLRLLTSHRIDVNTASIEYPTALNEACQYGSINVVKVLLEDARTDLKYAIHGKTPLMSAGENGHIEIFEMLLERYDKTDKLQEMDGDDNTHLLLAASSRNVRIVELVLERKGHDINHQNKLGQTALIRAVIEQHDEIVKRLLSEDGIDANIRTKDTGLAALHIAAKWGSVECIRALLSHGVDVNIRDQEPRENPNPNDADHSGRSALGYASLYGHIEAVRVLLEDVRIDVKGANNHGTTPLMSAGENGHIEIFEMLLERYDKTDKLQEMDGDDNTHLLLAASSDNVRIVELVLERKGHDINHQNKLGQTALIRALIDEHYEIFKRLLREDGIDANIRTKDTGLAALHLAAQTGSAECIRALLSHGVDVNIRDQMTRENPNGDDHSGDSALSYASLCGHIEAVRVLLEDVRIDVKGANNHGTTPLMSAGENGHIEIFEMLLERYDKTDKLQEMDGDDNTHLLLAASSDNVRIVELVLERKGHDINHQNKLGRTPLIRAVINGHAEVVKRLLREDGIDANIRTKDTGLAALHLAAQTGSAECIRALLSHGVDVNIVSQDLRQNPNPNDADHSGRSALGYASLYGYKEIVKVLLEDVRIDVKGANNHGTTPLLSVSQYGNIEIFEMLLERYDKTDKLQEMDGDDDTHLLLAASSGKVRIVELVLERKGHDINHQNKLGRTALIRAVINGHAEVVKRLLREDGIDVTLSTKEGETAFELAKKGGYEEIVALLKPYVVVRENEKEKGEEEEEEKAGNFT